MSSKNIVREQVIPIGLTIATFGSLVAILYLAIFILNLLPTSQKIFLGLRKRDFLVGFIIYLKTAIDFAIFIGNLMHKNPGWKKRIAIELGTAFGNGLGTILVLIVWSLFKEVSMLMTVMILIASFVLLEMAEGSLNEFIEFNKNKAKIIRYTQLLKKPLSYINNLTSPVLGFFIPDLSLKDIKALSFVNLIVFSFTIPFILGLDDFAGYIPLFSIINVFGFAIGTFAGHMLLNISLFISPGRTVGIVKNPIVLLLGGIVFIFIALFGFYEAVRIINSLFFNLL